jgi:hypothetical protein
LILNISRAQDNKQIATLPQCTPDDLEIVDFVKQERSLLGGDAKKLDLTLMSESLGSSATIRNQLRSPQLPDEFSYSDVSGIGRIVDIDEIPTLPTRNISRELAVDTNRQLSSGSLYSLIDTDQVASATGPVTTTIAAKEETVVDAVASQNPVITRNRPVLAKLPVPLVMKFEDQLTRKAARKVEPASATKEETIAADAESQTAATANSRLFAKGLPVPLVTNLELRRAKQPTVAVEPPRLTH